MFYVLQSALINTVLALLIIAAGIGSILNSTNVDDKYIKKFMCSIIDHYDPNGPCGDHTIAILQ